MALERQMTEDGDSESSQRTTDSTLPTLSTPTGCLGQQTGIPLTRGFTHNQIDFILTLQSFKSSINEANTRSFLGADIGSDHDLVLKPSS